jgi:hypothetical protein
MNAGQVGCGILIGAPLFCLTGMVAEMLWHPVWTALDFLAVVVLGL